MLLFSCMFRANVSGAQKMGALPPNAPRASEPRNCAKYTVGQTGCTICAATFAISGYPGKALLWPHMCMITLRWVYCKRSHAAINTDEKECYSTFITGQGGQCVVTLLPHKSCIWRDDLLKSLSKNKITHVCFSATCLMIDLSLTNQTFFVRFCFVIYHGFAQNIVLLFFYNYCLRYKCCAYNCSGTGH